MICPKCNQFRTNNDIFCYRCGTKLIKESLCKKCSETLTPPDKYCPKCGTQVEAAK